MKIFSRLSALVNVLILLTLVILFAVGTMHWYFDREGLHGEARVIEIPQGAGIIQIANELENSGLISSALLFRVMSEYEGESGAIKYGEYEIPPHASMREILDILVEGKAIQLTLTFPEGWTSWEVIQRLNAAEDLVGEISETPEEGALAPNTYAYLRGSDRAEILVQMEAAQAQILDEAWEGRDDDLPVKSKEELLILASIIEKETGTVDERPLVASVFSNRLKAGMKLQTDPTVIYGLTNGEGALGRGIRRSELEKETPYNTYVIEGLPPTPICNPGRASIFAAANPAKTDYLYFVAKTLNPADGHNFAKTLEAHNRNVQIFREAERAAQ